jgi:hypothetical protein
VGILDALFGRKRLPPSQTAKLGAIATAELTLSTELGATPSGSVGLAVKSVAASEFERVKNDLEQLLRTAGEDLGSTTALRTDEYGFVWVIMTDEDFSDLVAEAQITAQTLTEEGFRDQLLCAVFPFRDADGKPLQLVYSFKRGSFYAFAPRDHSARDIALELRVHALLEAELPLEKELEYRYPLWGAPLG